MLHTTFVFCSWTCWSAPATASFVVVDCCTATPEWRVPYTCAGCIDCRLGKLLLGPTEDFTVAWYAPFSWLSLLSSAWKQKSKHVYMYILCFFSIMPNQSINLSIKDACLHYWRSNYRSACLQKTDVTNMYIIHLKLSIHFILGLPLGLFPSIPLTYALTFAGLNFRGSQILAIFAFIFSWMRGISLWFVVSSESLLYIDVINCFGGGS